MQLYTQETGHNFKTNRDFPLLTRNSKVEHIVICECGGVGTRNKCGRDEYCPECGKWLDWSQEKRW